MTNNDILRRIRYTFNYNDAKMASILELVGYKVEPALITQWLKKEEDEAYVRCSDREFSNFLNGFIVEKRGKQEGKPLPKAEDHLNNNIILKKLKIALNLQSEELIAMISHGDFSISKHELSALFRNPQHHHFRECKDQLLRKFLSGMQVKYRGDSEVSSAGNQFSKAPKKPFNKTPKKPSDNPYANWQPSGNETVKVTKKSFSKPVKNKPKTRISKDNFKWPDMKN
ncbi:hypothetical protein C2869_05715 [Saccharobesus litoralis]|uniref:DUF1456 family protein n=1 Tax=Saccharobesus litoralis TaxID=2172099 RepID=A0A2S0VP35_9ALTE|nr:DUF1456 family protein [Saccharobesus litoralis]AWB65968.1 hypothetical protein C2869_05715 [Saccharobesus litoralis]